MNHQTFVIALLTLANLSAMFKGVKYESLCGLETGLAIVVFILSAPRTTNPFRRKDEVNN